MFNYFRYLLVILLVSLLFYPYTMTIPKEVIDTAMNKKLPIVKEKKGFILTINRVEIEDIVHNVMSVKAEGTMQMSASNRVGNFISKLFKKDVNKSIKVNIFTKIRPKINGINLSFDILELHVNSLIKQKKLNKYVRQKLEKVQIPIKRLKKMAWVATVKALIFDENQNLELHIKFSRLLILLLLPLLLLREIGLLCISIYQKFFSSRKKYKCAKGELHKNGTCSSTTKEAFQNHGFIAGMREYFRSKKSCKQAYHKINEKRSQEKDRCSSLGLGCDICGGSSIGICDVGSC